MLCYVMALKLAIRFPLFAPFLDPNPTHQRPSTELRFSRWNNANAERFNQRRRAQEEIEDDIRRRRRFDSVANIANADEASSAATVETFRSTGTPSAPSSPSIPGKKSKYSKKPPKPSLDPHPAFRFSNIPKSRLRPVSAAPENIKMDKDGVSYLIEGAPFEFKYSYTETPKVRPLKMREPAFVPFGPATMPRPWTGRAPLPPSKKKLKEFDSFVLPPPHKKGVKPVQSPGPFLPGKSPRYVQSREEILGEPLTQAEIDDLVKGSMKANRQLNIGRDGLTHNMLDNIHALWKRRRVSKIRCKGVCTVDMDNVCQQLEERTGGKIIYRKGGVLYLFRGRNYNYRTRPHFPLMLWKPVPPVYPRLIRRVPEGLTLEEATEMRRKGRNLIPICKLGKNGVYCDLVNNVKEAFEECELVRINCQGLNASDYRKIGAKLRDLVPCILLSFENDHILMWRGQNWKSSLPILEDDCKGADKIDVDNENYKTQPSEAQDFSAPCLQKNSVEHVSNVSHDTSICSSSSDVSLDKVEVPYPTENSKLSVSLVVTDADSLMRTYEAETTNDVTGSYGEPEPCGSTSSSNSCAKCPSEIMSDSHGTEDIMDSKSSDGLSASITGSDAMLGASDNSINGMVDPHADKLLDGSGAADVSRPSRSASPCMEGVLLLLEQAVEKGSALVLEEDSLDADNIYRTTVTFAKSAPPGPVFRKHRKVVVQNGDKQEGSTLETFMEDRKVVVQNSDKQEGSALETKETTIVSMKGKRERNSKIRRKENFDERCLNVVPQGTLGVDELAKLLT